MSTHEPPAAVIRRARERFDDGDRRAAWDALLVRARRHPAERAYRDALVDLYRRAGSPDQAARWGAHDPEQLTDRERRALRRSLGQFGNERDVRRYLVLPDGMPACTTEHLGSRRSRWRSRAEPLAAALVQLAALTAGLIGGIVLLVMTIAVLVMAFTGDPEVHSTAQIGASFALMVVVAGGGLVVLAWLARARWVPAALLAVVVVAAVVVLAHADMTSALPFG